MRSPIIKTIISAGLFVLICLVISPGVSLAARVLASAPTVSGRVASDTNAGVAGVWVKWADARGDVRYAQTDTGGYYSFIGWQDTNRDAEANNWIDTNLDGTGDAWQADASPANGGNRAGYIGFGCGENPHTFSVVQPAGWGGSFSTQNVNDVNNTLAAQGVSDIIYTPPPAPPTASINPPANNSSFIVGQGISIQAAVQDSGGDLSRGEIWVITTGQTLPAGCPGSTSGPWCNITTVSWNSGFNQTLSGSWTPTAAGTYWILVNAFDSRGAKCTGNPWTSFPDPGWSDCGPSDAALVSVSNLTAPACVSPANSSTVNPNSVSFFWGPVAGAAVYDFRLDNITTGQWDQIVVNGLTSTSYPAQNLSWGSSYQYRVFGRNPSQIGPWTTCSFSTSNLPTLGTSNKSPGPDASGGRGVGISGLRSDDPNTLSNTGTNVYNSVKLSQVINNANPGNVKLVGIAATSKSSPPANSSLYEMTRSAYNDNGFVLIYAQGSATQPYKTPNWYDGIQTFTAQRYYLYRQGSWIAGLNGTDITNDITTSQGYTTPDKSLNVKLDRNNQVPGNPTFDVTPLKPSGSHTWGTYGYLMDSSNTQTTQSF